MDHLNPLHDTQPLHHTAIHISRPIERAGDYGDCQAIGSRRPDWDDRQKMIASLSNFSKIYDERPFRENRGGMRFHHSFGLWYTLRAISPRPSFVVENGANRGHTTWLIRQALPEVRIITKSQYTYKNYRKHVLLHR